MINIRQLTTMRVAWAWWYALVVGVVLYGYAVTHADHAPWRIAIGESATRSFSAELGGAEFTDFYGGTTWFRHAPHASDIGIPRIEVPRIVIVRLFTRTEQAPATLWLQSTTLTIPLQSTGQLRRYAVYVPANQTVRIYCDTRTVTSEFLKTICASIVEIRGYAPTNTPVPWRTVLIPIGLWIGVALLCGRRLGASLGTQLLLISCAGLVAWYSIAHYPLQLLVWADGMSLGIGIVFVLFWVATHPRIPHGWVWGLVVIAVALRLFVYSAPGVDGVDRKVHARQLESVLYGDLYQQNTGTIVSMTTQTRQMQTYPYPPAAYLLMSPLILLLSPVMTFNYFVGAIAIIIDATLAVVVVWVITQQRLGRHVAWYSAIVVLFFPQAYVFHSYPVVAQAIAQWASWWFVCLALIAGDNATVRQRMVHSVFAVIAITGHFGAFLTMSIMQGIQWLVGTMRRTAWVWIWMAVVCTALYYSQYVSLILTQTGNIVQKAAVDRGTAIMDVWRGGIDDHYGWVVFVVGLLGLASSQLRTRPALRHTLWAGAATMLVLLVLRVVFAVNPTRVVIFVAPIIAIGVGLMANEYRRHRAGALMVGLLCAYFGYISITTWLTINIDQHLLRWALPQ